MKRRNIRIITSAALSAALIISAATFAFADSTDTDPILVAKGPGQQMGSQQFGGQGQMGGQFGGQGQMPEMGGQQGQMGGMMQSGSTSFASEPAEIVTSTLTKNSAESLEADLENAVTIVMSSQNSNVKISQSGTYIITGTCQDGNITVKKGTTGVVLILKDLDLTSTTGATVSLNKGTEVKVIVEGTVTLTDVESLADADSDDFDGAAIKAKAGSSVVLTGSGTLNINGSCKNGIKVSDLDSDDIADGYSEASFIIEGGSLTININAANDGINSGTDLIIKSGTINVSAGDDGIKADYILTIGEEGTEGPVITISKSYEGLEGATINICSGTVDITASDDGINAANSDLTGYTYSMNIMGGTITVSAGADGLDSNGNINITGGLTTIAKAASNGGEGGVDYEGSCYVADGCLNNPYGVTMDSGMSGQMGQNSPQGEMPQMNGQQGEMPQMPEMNGTAPSDMPEMGDQQFGGPQGEMPQMNGQQGEMPQMPEMSGDRPVLQQFTRQENAPGENPESSIQQAEQTVQTTDTQQDLGWFAKLINTIKGWFVKQEQN